MLGGVSGGAIREDNWKLIEYFDPTRPAKFELFDLAKDLGETNNLASLHPDRVEAMRGAMTSYLASKTVREALALSASSISLVKSPFPPIFASGRSRNLSPLVLIICISMAPASASSPWAADS